MQNQSQTPEPAKECYRCGRELPADAKTCPVCGRQQYRMCYCGKEIPVTAPQCPYCGADWSASRRVKRKKSRSSRVKSSALVRSAVIGAVVALVVAGFLNVCLSYFATVAVEGAPLPEDLFSLLDLAATGFRRVTVAWWQTAIARRGTLWALAICIIVGAGIGILAYLGRAVVLKLQRKSQKASRRRRSSRHR